MIDKDLLNKVLNLTKEAYTPPTPSPGQLGATAPAQDPALAGAALPMDPSMGGMPPDAGMAGMEMQPVTLSAQDLQMLIEAAAAAQAPAEQANPSEDTESSRVTNKELESRIDELEALLVQMANTMGIAVPETVPDSEAALPPSVANLTDESLSTVPMPSMMPLPEELPPLPDQNMPMSPASMPQQLEAAEQDNALIQVLRALGQYAE